MRRQTRSARYFAPQIDPQSQARRCDVPDCPEAGEYRAPKSRDHLTDYFWFCLEHVRTYNQSWNYLAGMNDQDVERMLRSDTVWQRPTWPMGAGASRREEAMRHRIYREFGLGGAGAFRGRVDEEQEAAGNREGAGRRGRAGASRTAAGRDEDRALAVLDLSWPVDFATIKARYRALAKQHHPDANNGSRDAEEVLKSINEAYAVLRASFAP